MKGKSTSKQAGYTLVELVIAIAILAVISVAISQLVVSVSRHYRISSIETLLSQEAQNTVNQLNQMIMDAPDEVIYSYQTGEGLFSPIDSEAQVDAAYADTDRALRIVNGNMVLKTVHFSREDKKLYYFEGLDPENHQVLAECVDYFAMDMTDFKAKRTATIDLRFETDGKIYQTSAQVTSRNEMPGETEQIKEKPKFQISPREIYLEPNEEYSLPINLIGSNEGYTLSVADSTSTDSSFVIENNTVKMKIGKDEKGTQNGIIYLNFTANEKNEQGNPVATARVTVRVRRVNDIRIAMALISGQEGKSGAVYEVSAGVSGTNLEKAVGMDYDLNYIDPRQVNWNTSFMIGADPVIDTTYIEYISSTTTGQATYKFRLLKDLPDNSKYTIQVGALHPIGSAQGVGDTKAYYNKSGILYGNLYAEVSLTKGTSGVVVEEKFIRHDNVDLGLTGDNSYTNSYTEGFFNGKTYQPHWYYRFREITSNGYGEWKPFRATQDGGSTLWLRAKDTARLEPDKYYQVEIIYAVVGTENNKSVLYYPINNEYLSSPNTGFTGFKAGWSANQPETPAAEYIHTYTVAPVELRFDFYLDNVHFQSQEAVGSFSTPLLIEAGKEIYFILDSRYMKLEGGVGVSPNTLKYKIERFTNQNQWVEVTNYNYVGTDNRGIKIKNNNEPWNNSYPNVQGIYRVTFRLVDYPLFTDGNSLHDTNYQIKEYRNYDLSDIQNNDGVIYFRIP